MRSGGGKPLSLSPQQHHSGQCLEELLVVFVSFFPFLVQ